MGAKQPLFPEEIFCWASFLSLFCSLWFQTSFMCMRSGSHRIGNKICEKKLATRYVRYMTRHVTKHETRYVTRHVTRYVTRHLTRYMWQDMWQDMLHLTRYISFICRQGVKGTIHPATKTEYSRINTCKVWKETLFLVWRIIEILWTFTEDRWHGELKSFQFELKSSAMRKKI